MTLTTLDLPVNYDGIKTNNLNNIVHVRWGISLEIDLV